MNAYGSQKALTVVGALVVAAILALVLASGTVMFVTRRDEARVRRGADEVVAALRLARSRVVAGQDNTNWGVHLEEDRFVLFKGDAYNQSDPDNETTFLDESVRIENILLQGGGSDVLFTRPYGISQTYGTFDVALKSGNAFRTVRVEGSGVVSIDTPPPTAPLNPNRDTRHVHLMLGWSIQSASTMTLTFKDPPNSDVVENISMGPYFNSDRTRFDWRGEVVVGGSAQKIRVHTHSLTGSDTTLSIVRDRRFNDKAVSIDIDGNRIIDYDENGVITVGPFGGTLEVQ